MTIHASTASSERSLSCLSRVGTYLRSTMLNERLSLIFILSIEKYRIKIIDINNIVDTFANNHNNKIIQLL